jgi:predicted ATPase
MLHPRLVDPVAFNPNLSILAQRRDPEIYPHITHLANLYDRISVYREWAFGRNTDFRKPQKTDVRTDRLEENSSNLALFLNRLKSDPKAKAQLLLRLPDLYDGLTDFEVRVDGGTAQVIFAEGHMTIPATRLSDGCLRYLCLLAILCDPNPPPFIGLEEPELGLHPDLIPKIADLLILASHRTQLAVTTHSDILVDAFSDTPEAVVICEKHEGQTQLSRLDRSNLKKWLSAYRLGQLWTRGDLGGTRW